MITYIAHLRVAPENAAAFEAAIADMARNVRQNEPGVVHYHASKSCDDPNLYMVVEVYRDEAAFQAHWETDYIHASVERTKPLIAEGSMDVRRYVSA